MTARLHADNLDLGQHELQNAVIQRVGSLPLVGSSVEGQVVHLNSDHKPYEFDGTTWVAMSASTQTRAFSFFA